MSVQHMRIQVMSLANLAAAYVSDFRVFVLAMVPPPDLVLDTALDDLLTPLFRDSFSQATADEYARFHATSMLSHDQVMWGWTGVCC
jgi:hypothetical protein